MKRSTHSATTASAAIKTRPRTVAASMTRAPHSIGRDQPIAKAHEVMRTLGIRHLPVLEGGKLAGIVTQRDLYFLESIGGVDGNRVTVEDAMSPDVYCVAPDAALGEVAKEMAERKYGCAVVMEGHAVVGVFTTTDALRALANALAGHED